MPSWLGCGLVYHHCDMYSVYVPLPLSMIHWRVTPPLGVVARGALVADQERHLELAGRSSVLAVPPPG